MKAQEDLETEIDVREAVQRAKEFAAMIFATEQISGLGLEAVERTDDGRYWLVTLGFTRPALTPDQRSFPSPIDEIFPRSQPREYKVFRIDASSGEVVAVDIFKQ